MTTGVRLAPLQTRHVPEVKRVISWVVHELFVGPPAPGQVDALLESYEARGMYSDLDHHEEQYSAPHGLFLVLLDGERVAGMGGIRRLDSETAELKRMWFLAEYRGLGWGRRLAEQLLAFAKEAGYLRVRLDTAERLETAQHLYRRLGFYPIDRYNDSVCDVFMEKLL